MKTLIGISMALLISISAYSENATLENDKKPENNPVKTEVVAEKNNTVVKFDLTTFMAIYKRSLQNVDSVYSNDIRKTIKKNTF